jgi:hypothetical protein
MAPTVPCASDSGSGEDATEVADPDENGYGEKGGALDDSPND